MEEIIDKASLTTERIRLHPLTSSLVRNTLYFCFVTAAGVSGIFGQLTIQFRYEYPIVGVIWLINSLGYDYFMRKVELSQFTSVFYIIPLCFILIDVFLLNQSFTPIQFVSMGMLVLGAAIMTFFTSKRGMLNWESGFWLLVKVISEITFLYFFKNLSSSGLNEISFLFNSWIYVVFGLSMLVCARNVNMRSESVRGLPIYISKMVVSKLFDFISGLLYLHAIAMATLSQVSALNAVSPIILLVLVKVFSYWYRPLEDVSPRIFGIKLIGIAILCTGGLLIVST